MVLSACDGEKRDRGDPGWFPSSEHRAAKGEESCTSPQRECQAVVAFLLHHQHIPACPHPMGWATYFLLPSIALESSKRHGLRERDPRFAYPANLHVPWLGCRKVSQAANAERDREERGCPASPIPPTASTSPGSGTETWKIRCIQEHLWRRCTCPWLEPQGSHGQRWGGKVQAVWQRWSLLFVVCSFPPPKNPKQIQSRSHGAVRPAAEVLRGGCGEGGAGKGGRRDQSHSWWEMDSNPCCLYLRRQMDVEPGFLEDP